MSIEKTSQGQWRVRWRAGGKNRSKVIGSKADARRYEEELRRMRRMGTLAHMEMGRKLLHEYGAEFRDRHIARLAPKTRTLYASTWNKHIDPHLGDLMLAEVTVAKVEDWIADMERRKVGRVAQQKAVTLLGQILNSAVKHGELAANPVTVINKPKHRKQPVIPPTPLEVERIREALLQDSRHGEATLVSVLAYAGLRPQEALALCWKDIRDRTILVGSQHKTGSRAVRILSPLALDLKEWRMATGSKWEIVFPNKFGREWTPAGFSSWRARTWKPLMDDLGYSFTPYALRHAFVSLLLAEGRSVVEVAEQAGHSPQMTLSTYAHTLAEVEGTQRSAEDQIREARAMLSERAEAV